MRLALEAYEDFAEYRFTFKNLSSSNPKLLKTSTCVAGWPPYFYDQEDVRTYFYTANGWKRLIECPPFPTIWPLARVWKIMPPDKPDEPGTAFARLPLLCTVSPDGEWVLAYGMAEAHSISRNANYSCMHLEHDWPELAPGAEHTVVQRIYLLRGGLNDALARWQRDFPDGQLPPLQFTRVTKNQEGTITVEWTGGGTLQAAPTVSGTWQDVGEARSPFTFRPAEPMLFQRLYRWSP